VRFAARVLRVVLAMVAAVLDARGYIAGAPIVLALLHRVPPPRGSVSTFPLHLELSGLALLFSRLGAILVGTGLSLRGLRPLRRAGCRRLLALHRLGGDGERGRSEASLSERWVAPSVPPLVEWPGNLVLAASSTSSSGWSDSGEGDSCSDRSQLPPLPHRGLWTGLRRVHLLPGRVLRWRPVTEIGPRAPPYGAPVTHTGGSWRR
jgi:hypothetical protein